MNPLALSSITQSGGVRFLHTPNGCVQPWVDNNFVIFGKTKVCISLIVQSTASFRLKFTILQSSLQHFDFCEPSCKHPTSIRVIWITDSMVLINFSERWEWKVSTGAVLGSGQAQKDLSRINGIWDDLILLEGSSPYILLVAKGSFIGVPD